tara:strand:- start:241 stop:405 length:165 start_codon:yes stop_codon:yes gene_type:complete
LQKRDGVGIISVLKIPYLGFLGPIGDFSDFISIGGKRSGSIIRGHQDRVDLGLG